MYSVFSAERVRNANADEENIKVFSSSGRLDTDALASELTGQGLPASGKCSEFSIMSGLLQAHNCALVNTNQVSMHYVVRKSD